MKGYDLRMAAQQFKYALFLDALAFSVDDTHRCEAGLDAGLDVVLDQRRKVLGPEGVQVDDVFNRDADGVHVIGI